MAVETYWNFLKIHSLFLFLAPRQYGHTTVRRYLIEFAKVLKQFSICWVSFCFLRKMNEKHVVILSLPPPPKVALFLEGMFFFCKNSFIFVYGWNFRHGASRLNWKKTNSILGIHFEWYKIPGPATYKPPRGPSSVRCENNVFVALAKTQIHMFTSKKQFLPSQDLCSESYFRQKTPGARGGGGVFSKKIAPPFNFASMFNFYFCLIVYL